MGSIHGPALVVLVLSEAVLILVLGVVLSSTRTSTTL
jgi:phosphate starvation-inducible membrane PsiE